MLTMQKKYLLVIKFAMCQMAIGVVTVKLTPIESDSSKHVPSSCLIRSTNYSRDIAFLSRLEIIEPSLTILIIHNRLLHILHICIYECTSH